MTEPKFKIPKIIRNVGTGILAGVLYTGSPTDVLAQAKDLVEAEQTDINKSIFFALEEAKKRFSEARRIIGDERYYDANKKLLEDTEKVIKDKKFIAGIEFLKQQGAKVKDIVGYLEPEIVMDIPRMQKALDMVPDEIKGKIQIYAGMLKFPEKQNYLKPGLFSLVNFMHEKGIVPDMSTADEFLESEEEYPDLRNLAWKIHEGTKGKVEMLYLPWKLKSIKIPFNIFNDPNVTEGFIDLINRGIGIYDIFPFATWENEIPSLAKGLASKELRDVYTKMFNFGYNRSFLKLADIAQWSPDVYNNDNFDKNAKLLAPSSRDFSSIDFNKYPKVLMIENLEILIEAVPVTASYVSRDKMYQFIETVYDNKEALNMVFELLKKYPKGFGKILFDLTVPKLVDKEYIEILSRTWESGNMGESAKKSLFDVTMEYVEKKTGTDAKQLFRDLTRFVTIYRDPNTTPVTKEFLEQFKRFAFANPIIRMNELHDGNAQTRLEVLGTHDARVLFEVMLTGGADAYLSTFRLLYNGNGQTDPNLLKYTFIQKVKADPEFSSLFTFIKKVNPDKKDFGRLLQFISQHDLMDAFLSDIGDSIKQKEILTSYVFDIRTDLDTLQAVTLDDLLSTTTNKQIRDFIFESFRNVVEGKVRVSKEQKTTIKLLLTSSFRDAKEVPDWAKETVEKYKVYFPPIETLGEDKMFRNEEGVETNNQVHFFYDDRGPKKPETTWDGHQSFKNFLVSLGGSVIWDKEGKLQKISVGKNYTMKDEEGYLVISKKYKSGRVVKMFVTKPDRSDTQVKETGEKLMREIKPQMVVHRGHSYHASKTISLLNQEVMLVNLGSCGGANNISSILDKSPTAQVMSTRNVGTMLVNDALIIQINDALGTVGEVKWPSLREKMNAEFRQRGGLANERWQSYLLPSQNRTAHLISALKKLAK